MAAYSATYDTLRPDQQLHGFLARAVYLDDSGRPMGARFDHDLTGFTLHLLEMQSVPQAFVWVTTPPTSDMGEPHTQEHLLLSKGRTGRALQAFETMSLVGSTAFTSQYRTCYPFHTVAGPETFFEYFQRQLQAMLAPDYSDEEIRREVRNFGVIEDPGNGTLRLEEKGSIYNEMVSSMTQGSRLAFHERQRLVYGARHPLAFVSGGAPEAIRRMRPEHIREFHRRTHHLANMSAVAAFPSGVSLTQALTRFDEALTRLQAGAPRRTAEPPLPDPNPAPHGAMRVVEYPHRNEQQPSMITLGWPAVLESSEPDQLLFQLFLDNFAGDSTTNLYKRFIDSRTRKMDIGARSVNASLTDDAGAAAAISFPDASPANAEEARMAEIRANVLDELRIVSAWAADSPELAEFNARMRSRLAAFRRAMSKFVSEPPRFGFRGAYSNWVDQVTWLERRPGFRKSLTLRPELAEVESVLAGRDNIWEAAIKRWRLLDRAPYVVAARPSPDLVAREARERDARIAAEVERLRIEYAATGPQEAIRRYRADYDRRTAELGRLDAETRLPPFTSSPPMTLDDTLDYRITTAAGVTAVNSRFPGMTSATAGLALRVPPVDSPDLVYLAAIPTLLTSTGVIRDGKPVSYDEMSEALRNEILSLDASFSTNAKTGRVEIVLRGSGNDLAETRRALEWMRLALYHPYWLPENLPRIRDVVDRQWNGLRATMQRAEEQWVRDPPTAWWRQAPVLLTAASFLTRAHHFRRLRWLLQDPPAPGCAPFFEAAAALPASLTRPGLLKEARDLAAGQPPECRAVSASAVEDLEAALPDIPDSSLAADWRYLCRQMRDDLLRPPADALARLDSVRRGLLARTRARVFQVSSPENEAPLMEAAAPLLAGLREDASRADAARRMEGSIRLRYLEREKAAGEPRYVALAAPNMRGGVIVNWAPLTGYDDLDRESLLRHLAASVYSGSGAHALFMKTWAAGLAYSNGAGSVPALGIFQYYAERTPELPQTLRFVIDELKRAPRDIDLADYALAQTFRSVSAQTFESRAESMAAALADGLPPEKVRRFRQALLDLRKEPDLMRELSRRLDLVYGSVLPGYAEKQPPADGAVYFVIGPEQQLSLYEDHLRRSIGAQTRLHRLFPRDFWITPVRRD